MKKSRVPMPVLIHPRLSKIATNPSDFFERMNLYASNISNQIKKPEFKLTLLIGLRSQNLPLNCSSTYPHLRVIRISDPTLNFYYFAKRSFALLAEQQIKPNILIAGDLTVGLMASFQVRSRYRVHLPIQISIHGSPNGQTGNFVSFLKLHFRNLVLRYSLSYIQSIRVVSREVEHAMVKSFRLEPKKIFIAPIPFANYPEFQTRDFRKFNIGVIGRMHAERNLDEILKILEDVVHRELISRVLFIGSGPLEGKVRIWKSRTNNSEKIYLEGARSRAEVMDRLPSIDILLSAAKSEGYGLAIREALVSGAIVVARRNEGTIEILESFQAGIYLYDTVFEAQEIMRNLLSGDKSLSQCTEGQKIQKSIDRESVKRICDSWSLI